AASSSLRQDPADTPIDEPQVVMPDLRTEGLRKKAPALFDPSADPVKDIAAAAARAKREDRRVLILWGADWCSWSRSLHSLLTESKRILRAVAGEYEVVRIDVGKYDRNADLLASYGVDLARTRSADTLYATALAAAARVKKCLLLHFEAPQRPGCEALEEWLDAPEV